MPSLDLILQGSEWLARGRASEALHCAEEALRQEPHDADALFLLGAAHYRDGDLAAAEARLKQAIQANGKVAVFHSTLGNVYQDRGALPEAVAAYRRAIRLKPDFAEAHNDLGTAFFAQGDPVRAAESYRRATELRPDHAVAYANLGAVYRKLGMPREARHALQRELVLRLRNFFRLKKRHRSLAELAHEELRLGNPGLALRIGRRALEQDANNPRVVALLAAALRQEGSLEEAIGCAQRAVELRPADARSREQLGSLLLKAGSAQSALPHLEECVRLQPRSPQALLALAEAHMALGDREQASQLAQRSSALEPKDATLWVRLGELLSKQGLAAQAELAFRRAIELDPAAPAAWIRLAGLLRLGGRLQEAKTCAEQAVALDDESSAALIALGLALREQGRTSAAVARFEQALRLEPQRAQALQQIGEILHYENKIEEAERRFRDGLKSRPDSIALLVDLAMVLGDQMRYAEAFACLEKALAHDPRAAPALAAKGILQDLTGREAEAESLLRSALQAAPQDADIGHSLASCRLRHWHFDDGWKGFELRRHKENFIGRYRKFPFVEWQGEPLDGKSILVYPEQGLGDEIMYASCIPELVARARHVAVECDHKLGALFARSFPGCTVTARLRTMANDWVNHLEPRPDYQVPMGSLPGHFRRRVEDFPQHGGYLAPDGRKVAAWKRRLDAIGPGPKVGLSWQGGVGHTGRARRSLTLEQLLPLLRLDGVHFVSLQYTDVDGEIRDLAARHGITVHHWQGAIDVYDETAALVCALDRVVTVCTALVHLTGALGRPAIVMVPFGSDWRYGAQGERMLWYPSVRLIRQGAIGDWPPVIESVRRLLQG
ncbi:MAG: tetratricopeptide repeat protein [Betaproteobacteria bacterium]|nr:MAG: tetratricopeptide repeat protein [Betaproteobacteria bacterium]